MWLSSWVSQCGLPSCEQSLCWTEQWGMLDKKTEKVSLDLGFWHFEKTWDSCLQTNPSVSSFLSSAGVIAVAVATAPEVAPRILAMHQSLTAPNVNLTNNNSQPKMRPQTRTLDCLRTHTRIRWEIDTHATFTNLPIRRGVTDDWSSWPNCGDFYLKCKWSAGSIQAHFEFLSGWAQGERRSVLWVKMWNNKLCSQTLADTKPPGCGKSDIPGLVMPQCMCWQQRVHDMVHNTVGICSDLPSG